MCNYLIKTVKSTQNQAKVYQHPWNEKVDREWCYFFLLFGGKVERQQGAQMEQYPKPKPEQSSAFPSHGMSKMMMMMVMVRW